MANLQQNLTEHLPQSLAQNLSGKQSDSRTSGALVEREVRITLSFGSVIRGIEDNFVFFRSWLCRHAVVQYS